MDYDDCCRMDENESDRAALQAPKQVGAMEKYLKGVSQSSEQ